MLTIRSERPGDYAEIAEVVSAAFERDNEARLVAELRKIEAFDPELSRVAVRDDCIVGHILFTPIQIEHEQSSTAASALAPMAVHPTVQRQGIGSDLVRNGLDTCRQRGHQIVIVVGHPTYYPRFGFTPARSLGLEAPFPVPNEAFLALALTPGALNSVQGVVRYSCPFDDV